MQIDDGFVLFTKKDYPTLVGEIVVREEAMISPGISNVDNLVVLEISKGSVFAKFGSAVDAVRAVKNIREHVSNRRSFSRPE